MLAFQTQFCFRIDKNQHGRRGRACRGLLRCLIFCRTKPDSAVVGLSRQTQPLRICKPKSSLQMPGSRLSRCRKCSAQFLESRWSRGFAFSYNPTISIVGNTVATIALLFLVYIFTRYLEIIGAVIGVFSASMKV